MLDINQLDEIEQAPKRPTFLLVLCILTLITTGFGILGGTYSLITGPMDADQVEMIVAQNNSSVTQLRELGSEYWANQIQKIGAMVQYTNANFWMNTLVSLLASGIGLFAVISMLKGKKLGFHSYIIYSLFSLSIPYFSVPMNEIPNSAMIFNGIISAIFVFMYSRNLHWMTK